MQPGRVNVALLGVASTLASSVLAGNVAWTAFSARAIMFGRLDPIVSPGQVSAHTHMFFGPDNIQPDADYASLRKSTCSTLGTGDADYSAYWVPALYHISADNKYTLLPLKGHEIYYGYARDGTDTPYPPGFKMIVGSPLANRHNCTGGSPASASCNNMGAYYYCLDSTKPKGWGLESDMPRRRCDDRIGYHITFPQCWDGKDFTLATQDQHLRYGNNDLCPAGYKRLPQIMFEFWFDTLGLPANSPDKDTYTLAFGGNRGAGLHGDFLSGWDPKVMQNIIDNCAGSVYPGGKNDAYLCPILKQKQSEQYKRLEAKQGNRACMFSGQVPQENVGLANNRAAIPSLPGCNPMHDVNGKMPTCTSTCTPPMGPIGSFYPRPVYAPIPAAQTCSAVTTTTALKTIATSSSVPSNPKPTSTISVRTNPKAIVTSQTSTFPRLVRSPVSTRPSSQSTATRAPVHRARSLMERLH